MVQYMNGTDNEAMTSKIIKEFTILKTTSEHILAWATRVGAQRSQKTMLFTLQEINKFDMIKDTIYSSDEQSMRPLRQRNM